MKMRKLFRPVHQLRYPTLSLAPADPPYPTSAKKGTLAGVRPRFRSKRQLMIDL